MGNLFVAWGGFKLSAAHLHPRRGSRRSTLAASWFRATRVSRSNTDKTGEPSADA